MFLTLLSLNYKVQLNLLKMRNAFRMQHTNIYSVTRNNEEARQRASQSGGNRFNLWVGISDLGGEARQPHGLKGDNDLLYWIGGTTRTTRTA